MRTTVAAASLGLAVLLAGPRAGAQPKLEAGAKIDFAPTPPEGKTSEADSTLPTAPPEAPPPRPRHKGLVLETTAGMLAFAGEFRHVSPPAPWIRAQLGYEILGWLMVFGETEFAYTDTSEAQDPSHSTAFPLFGFGGGARATIHVTDRVALFLQGDAGALEAIVPHGTLTTLGFANTESLALAVGGRVGVEWYQVDRHMALTAQGGLRDAQGFARSLQGSSSADLPLLWDASLGLRYTF